MPGFFPQQLACRGPVKACGRKKFDVAGIGFFTPQTDLAQKTAAVVKRVLPNSKVVFGGIHVTSVPV